MKKPKQFQVVYQTTRNVPYTTAHSSLESRDNCGGVLCKGSRVWLAQEKLDPHASLVTAYADHIGMVSLSSKSLKQISSMPNEKSARAAVPPAAPMHPL